jgi:hypothetical protein
MAKYNSKDVSERIAPENPALVLRPGFSRPQCLLPPASSRWWAQGPPLLPFFSRLQPGLPGGGREARRRRASPAEAGSRASPALFTTGSKPVADGKAVPTCRDDEPLQSPNSAVGDISFTYFCGGVLSQGQEARPAQRRIACPPVDGQTAALNPPLTSTCRNYSLELSRSRR